MLVIAKLWKVFDLKQLHVLCNWPTLKSANLGACVIALRVSHAFLTAKYVSLTLVFTFSYLYIYLYFTVNLLQCSEFHPCFWQFSNVGLGTNHICRITRIMLLTFLYILYMYLYLKGIYSAVTCVGTPVLTLV